MRSRPPRILDASAIVALFRGDEYLGDLLEEAERQQVRLLLPTTAIADAEAEVRAGSNGWEAILLTAGLNSLPFTEHAAIDSGGWPGALSARHAAHEALAVRAIVITRDPAAYAGHRVYLQVI